MTMAVRPGVDQKTTPLERRKKITLLQYINWSIQYKRK